MKDLIVVIAVSIAFAALLTAHVAIAFGLLGRRPRWRGPVAFAMIPLAPYWAWRERMRVRAIVWSGALVLYVIARIVASV